METYYFLGYQRQIANICDSYIHIRIELSEFKNEADAVSYLISNKKLLTFWLRDDIIPIMSEFDFDRKNFYEKVKEKYVKDPDGFMKKVRAFNNSNNDYRYEVANSNDKMFMLFKNNQRLICYEENHCKFISKKD